MREIPLSRGQVALVDDEDYGWLVLHKWHLLLTKGRMYAKRTIRSENREVLMHREIIGAGHGVKVDHRDGNGINNQRSNLREATQSQNGANRGRQINNTSGFKGVVWHKAAGKWCARIKVCQQSIHLGLFENLRDAAAAHNHAALEHFGEFAKLNPL